MVQSTVWLSTAIALVAFIVGLTAREWLPQLQQLQPWQGLDYEGGVVKSHEPASADHKTKAVSNKPKDELRASGRYDPVADSESVSDILSASRFTPNSATKKLQRLVDSGAFPPASAAELKMHLAEQLTKVRRFDDAALLREQLLADRARKKDLSIADFVLATASIAQDWQGAMDYERALATLAKLPLDKLDAGSKSIVTRLEADVHAWYGFECLRWARHATLYTAPLDPPVPAWAMLSRHSLGSRKQSGSLCKPSSRGVFQKSSCTVRITESHAAIRPCSTYSLRDWQLTCSSACYARRS